MDEATFVSQTAKTRCAVEGRLVNGGGACTVVLVHESSGWVFYPHGITGLAVHIAEHDASTMATTILRNLG